MALLYPGLPREIRDYIYEYVLTDLGSLYCRRGYNGLSRICASTGDERVPSALAIGNPLSLLRSACSNVNAMFSLSCKRQIESFNQIQYVNRAFYTETSGLEFMYNSIVFEDSGCLSAGQRCRVFVNKVASRTYARDLQLCIIGSQLSLHWEFKGQRMTLFEYCAQYPKATIRWRDPNWSLTDPNFVSIGLAYITALRGDQDKLARLLQQLDPLPMLDIASISRTLPNKVPRNYRILPAEKHLSMATLTEAYGRSFTRDGVNINHWVSQVEEWFEVGV
jgi:hypothetical protein